MSLLRLPTELLLSIQGALEDRLLTHVCFMQLHPRTAALYDQLDPAFWRRLCRNSGIGMLHSDAQDSYRDIAVQCAEHAWACKHPGCGVARLQENERILSELRMDELGYDFTAPVHDETDVLFWVNHEVWPCIAFREGSGGDYRAFLDVPEDDEYTVTLNDTLELHPVVLRSFATFPPCQRMCLNTFKDIPTAGNEHGVTVSDVAHSLLQIMPHSPTTAEVATWFIHNVYGDHAAVVPETWSIDAIFRATSSVFHWFRLVRWAGFEYEGSSDGGHEFFFYFYARQLPLNSDEFFE